MDDLRLDESEARPGGGAINVVLGGGSGGVGLSDTSAVKSKVTARGPI